jgi:hypothetical protein
MIRSMTGFASVTRDTPHGRIGVDLRSVNHRYLEPMVRLPDELRSVEPALREAVAARLSRGKVDVRVSWQAPAGGGSGGRVGVDRVGVGVGVDVAVAAASAAATVVVCGGGAAAACAAEATLEASYAAPAVSGSSDAPRSAGTLSPTLPHS